tara:strand:+ start:212 stop:418 length:207 start_codon:yes stop_codon:yes gene_type:complete
MPSLPTGTVVNIGDEIPKIWNTGIMVNRFRRTALHFAVFLLIFLIGLILEKLLLLKMDISWIQFLSTN